MFTSKVSEAKQVEKREIMNYLLLQRTTITECCMLKMKLNRGPILPRIYNSTTNLQFSYHLCFVGVGTHAHTVAKLIIVI